MEGRDRGREIRCMLMQSKVGEGEPKQKLRHY